MAFDYTNLYPDTASNGSLTKTWNYTTLDSSAVVSASGYFNKVYNRLGIGDIIYAACVDAFDARFRTSVASAFLLVTGIVGQVVTTTAVTGLGSGSGDMLRANNLSDVTSVETSRTNLGITATGLDTTYNFRANNLSDVASAATARTNLAALGIANNLSDVASASTSRVNLGLSDWAIEVVLDGGGSALTTGMKGYIEVPFAITLTQATLLADRSGSVVVDIFKCTYAQFDAGGTHPVSGDKITASAPPTISSATKSQDVTLTGWTTSIAAGSILGFNINSATTIQQATLSLRFTR